jgi:hypothetical protein
VGCVGGHAVVVVDQGCDGRCVCVLVGGLIKVVFQSDAGIWNFIAIP